MKILNRFCLVTVFAGLPAFADGAGFDCTAASTPAENMICADEELSRHDGSLGRSYRWARSRVADPKTLRNGQRAWLRDVRDACPDDKCLKSAYKKRIGELSEIGGMTAAKEHARGYFYDR